MWNKVFKFCLVMMMLVQVPYVRADEASANAEAKKEEVKKAPPKPRDARTLVVDMERRLRVERALVIEEQKQIEALNVQLERARITAPQDTGIEVSATVGGILFIWLATLIPKNVSDVTGQISKYTAAMDWARRVGIIVGGSSMFYAGHRITLRVVTWRRIQAELSIRTKELQVLEETIDAQMAVIADTRRLLNIGDEEHKAILRTLDQEAKAALEAEKASNKKK